MVLADFGIGAIAGFVIGGSVGTSIYGSQAISGELSWGQFALDIGVGAITGLIGGSGISKGVSTVLSGVVGAGSNLASQLISGGDLKNVSIMQIILAGAMGVVSGLIGGAGARNKEAISNGENVQKATKQLNKVIRRIANGYRYNATTAQVAFTNAMNELTSTISLQIGQMFTKAMVLYGLSTMFSLAIDAICDNFDLWFF